MMCWMAWFYMTEFWHIALAGGLVGLMGFSIQRGATCIVAAMDEIVNQHKTNRLRAMLEASLWVAGGLLLARTLGLSMASPGNYQISWMTFLGGMLLGLGAYVNRACVFGAIARFGSGDWSYAMTPVGFYAGALLYHHVLGKLSSQKSAYVSPLIEAPAQIAWLFVAFALWRIVRSFIPNIKTIQPGASAEKIWTPTVATIVIGITFVIVLLLVGGTWAYTDVLVELASTNMTKDISWRILLLAALLAGAVLGGWSAGRLQRPTLNGPLMLRCFLGGAIMALGGVLVPGSNDGLILLGIPLLFPHAIVAVSVMCATVGLALYKKI